jgi:ATP-binding cassette, subfamily A (ABC1), member 3
MMTAVVSYLVVERIDGLKHLQEISGMQLKAYWVGNFIIDFIKMQLTIAITIICF